MEKFVAYYRVSTARQGASGLGLESQQAAVATFAQGIGLIVAEFTEVESGKKNQRPQLAAAIAAARASKATLLIAKLDRLSRNIQFIFELRDSGVLFRACDIPEANTLTIGIFAVVAQHEREMISKRTKAALAAKKARGVILGNPANFTAASRALGRAAMQAQAREAPANKQARRLASLLRRDGLTLAAIAEELNTSGYRTRRGNPFTKKAISRLLPPLVPAAAAPQMLLSSAA